MKIDQHGNMTLDPEDYEANIDKPMFVIFCGIEDLCEQIMHSIGPHCVGMRLRIEPMGRFISENACFATKINTVPNPNFYVLSAVPSGDEPGATIAHLTHLTVRSLISAMIEAQTSGDG